MVRVASTHVMIITNPLWKLPDPLETYSDFQTRLVRGDKCLRLSLQTNRGEQWRLEALWLDRTLIHPARLNPRSSFQRLWADFWTSVLSTLCIHTLIIKSGSNKDPDSVCLLNMFVNTSVSPRRCEASSDRLRGNERWQQLPWLHHFLLLITLWIRSAKPDPCQPERVLIPSDCSIRPGIRIS